MATLSDRPYFFDVRDEVDAGQEGRQWASSRSGGQHSTSRVSYYFPKSVGEHHFGVSLLLFVGMHALMSERAGIASDEASPLNFDKSFGAGLRAAQEDGRLSTADGIQGRAPGLS